jgi:hypothetical protein
MSARPSGEIASGAPTGLLNLGIQGNADVRGVLDLQAATTLAVGGTTSGPSLPLPTVGASLGGGTTSAAGPTTLSLNLGLSANSSSGAMAGSSSNSAGVNGQSGGLALLLNLDLGGQNARNPQQGVGGQGAAPLEVQFPPVIPPGIVPAFGAIANNTASVSAAPVLMISPPNGLPPQAGLPALFPTNPREEASEEAQLAISLLRPSMNDQVPQEKATPEEILDTPTRNQLPGRPAPPMAATPPGACGEGDDNSTAPSSSSSPEALDDSEMTEPIPWLFPFPGALGLDAVQANGFGPFDNLSSLILEDLESLPQRFEALMEWVEVDGISPASWVLLGLAGFVAYEFARRRFRADARADMTGEYTGEPAIV